MCRQKFSIIGASFALLMLLLIPFSALSADGNTLVVYTYDSFVSWGPAKYIEKHFEQRTGAEVKFVATGDSRKMLTALKREKATGQTQADIFLGIERSDIPKTNNGQIFRNLKKKELPNLDTVRNSLLSPGEDDRLIPYEYGYITIVYDSKKIAAEQVPQTFEQLAQAKYKNQLIVEDPRISSPGFSFLLWTIKHYGSDYIDYWKRLRSNILTVPGGWSAAYSLFQRGEAPMVVSFSTDTASSVIAHGNARYKIALLNNEAYLNVYYMGIVKGTDSPSLAHKFLNFVLSQRVQEKIPTSEWMFPANRTARLPLKFYQYAVRPPESIVVSLDKIAENQAQWLKEWTRVIK